VNLGQAVAVLDFADTRLVVRMDSYTSLLDDVHVESPPQPSDVTVPIPHREFHAVAYASSRQPDWNRFPASQHRSPMDLIDYRMIEHMPLYRIINIIQFK